MIGQAFFTALLAVVLVPLVSRLCHRFGIMDIPRDLRRMHSRSIPRGGGIAIFLAYALSTLAFYPSQSHFLQAAWIGGSFLFLLGLIDDAFCLGPWCKLFFQGLITVGSLLQSGAYRGLSLLVGVFWVLLLTNAHNLIDGLDGLLAGCGALEGIGLFLIAGILGLHQIGLAPLLLAGACLGFLCFNRYPASIFAGDCGALSIGFFLGFYSLPLLQFEGSLFVGLVPLFLFSLPITDLICAALRRILQGNSPVVSDRAHLHHRICDAGVPHPQCVQLLHTLSALFVGIAVMLCSPSLFAFGSAICILCALFLLRFHFLVEGFP